MMRLVILFAVPPAIRIVHPSKPWLDCANYWLKKAAAVQRLLHSVLTIGTSKIIAYQGSTFYNRTGRILLQSGQQYLWRYAWGVTPITDLNAAENLL
mgnify:FL=1